MFRIHSVKKMMTLTEKEAYLRLQPTLQEVFDLEAEHVVELHAVIGEHAGPHLGQGEGGRPA